MTAAAPDKSPGRCETLSRPSGRLLSDRAGATAIEFALIGPIFLLVLLAVFDIGRLVLVSATIEYAAQEGAGFASLHGSSSIAPATEEQISARVRGLIRGVDPDDVSVDVRWSPDSSSGSTVAVQTGYEHRILMGLLPIPPLSLSGQASLVVM